MYQRVEVRIKKSYQPLQCVTDVTKRDKSRAIVKTFPWASGSAWDRTPSHVGKQARGLPEQPEVGETQDGRGDKKRPADPREVAVVSRDLGARKVSVASDGYFSQQHIQCDSRYQRNDSLNYSGDRPFQTFIIEAACNSLKNGLGNTLIDTGSQVTLVRADSLARRLKINKHVLKIHGITGNFMVTKGYVDLCVGDATSHKFLMAENLPMNCEVLLGQDWLERFGCRFQIPSVNVDIILPAYSGTQVRIPTTEKGSRLVEAQELQENVLCIKYSRMHYLVCLIVNCNSTDETLRKFPQTQEFSKLI